MTEEIFAPMINEALDLLFKHPTISTVSIIAIDENGQKVGWTITPEPENTEEE